MYCLGDVEMPKLVSLWLCQKSNPERNPGSWIPLLARIRNYSSLKCSSPKQGLFWGSFKGAVLFLCSSEEGPEFTELPIRVALGNGSWELSGFKRLPALRLPEPTLFGRVPIKVDIRVYSQNISEPTNSCL